MKFLIIFALFLAIANASPVLYQRELVVPVLDEALDGRITNGQTATAGQFPHQVGLTLQLSLFSSAFCGASLIGTNWVLTAAHCTDGVTSVTVYLGSTVRTSADVKYTVKQSDIIIHPEWDSSTLKNDISLIKIPSVSYSNNIQPVKLPAVSRSYSTYVGEEAIASGWGLMSDTSKVAATNLQYAIVPVVANTVCSKIYGSSVVSTSNVCISTDNKVSTCSGDSGGPLLSSATNELIGLTSYGAKAGCAKGYPAAFTRITSYLDWIKTETGIYY